MDKNCAASHASNETEESPAGEALSTTPPTCKRFWLLLAHWTIQMCITIEEVATYGVFFTASALAEAVLFDIFIGTDSGDYLAAWLAVIFWLVTGPPLSFLGGYSHVVLAEKKSVLWCMLIKLFFVIGATGIWVTNYSFVVATVKTVRVKTGVDKDAAMSLGFTVFFATLLIIGPLYSFITGNLIDWFISSIPFANVNKKWKESMSNEKNNLSKANSLLVENSENAGAFMPAYTLSAAVVTALKYWAGDNAERQAQVPVYGWSICLFTFFTGLAAYADITESKKRFEEKNKQVDNTRLRHKFILHLFAFYGFTATFLPAVCLWDIIQEPFANDLKELLGLGAAFAILGPFVLAYLTLTGMGENFLFSIGTTLQLLAGYALSRSGGILDVLLKTGEELSMAEIALKLLAYFLFLAITSPLLKYLKDKANVIVEYPTPGYESAEGVEENNNASEEEDLEFIRKDNAEKGLSSDQEEETHA